MVSRVEDYVAVEEALKSVTKRILLKRKVEVIQVEKSYGRISAANVGAPADLPAFATSHMDGFAVIADDLKGAEEVRPKILRIKGEVRLGASSKVAVGHGEAVQVATGARIPPQADTVIPSELAGRRGTKLVVTFKPEPGSHVYARGEGMRRNETVLGKGDVIKAQDIGLLLKIGLTKVRVWAKPRVSLIATGSELTTSSRFKSGMVRDSHSIVFLKLVGALGCEPVSMRIVKDDPAEVSKIVKRGLRESDCVVTLGGTSVGKQDVAGEAVRALGPDVVFHGIRMDRGRVAGVAVVRGKPVLMLPGPIQGAMSAFVVLGTRIIEQLSGRKTAETIVVGRMGEKWVARKRFPHFKKVVYVKLRAGEETVAEPLAGETESVKVLADADGYVVVEESQTTIEKGSRVEVRLLPGFSFA